MNSLRLCGGSAATTDMLAMNRTFMRLSLRPAAEDAERLPRTVGVTDGGPTRDRLRVPGA